MRRPQLALSIVALAGLWLSTGCTPTSAYRYSGMVPAARPIAFDGRTAEKGTARIEGTLTHENVVTNDLPVLHDSAIHVPETTVEGALTYAVHDHVELGARLSYAHYAWTRPSSLGAPPLPDRPAQIGVGPELRLAFPLDRGKRWVFGAAFDLLHYTLPTAEWELTSSCTTSPKCYVETHSFDGAPRYYAFRQQTNESVWLANVSMLLSYAFGPRSEFGHLFAGLAFHPTFTNDGFTDVATAKGQVEQKGWLPIAVAGYGVRLSPARLSASLFLPMGGDSTTIRYGLGGQLTLGFEFGGKHDEEPNAVFGKL